MDVKLMMIMMMMRVIHWLFFEKFIACDSLIIFQKIYHRVRFTDYFSKDLSSRVIHWLFFNKFIIAHGIHRLFFKTFIIAYDSPIIFQKIYHRVWFTDYFSKDLSSRVIHWLFFKKSIIAGVIHRLFFKTIIAYDSPIIFQKIYHRVWFTDYFSKNPSSTCVIHIFTS